MVADYYGKTLSESVGEIYWQSLNRFDSVSIERAIHEHVGDKEYGTYMPLPGDIIERIEGNAEERAYHAWQRVWRMIQHFGGYHTLVFDDARIHASIADMGGWIKLCQTIESDLSKKEDEFKRRYTFYFFHPPEKFPRALIGIHDHQNKLYGFDYGVPIYVGDIDKAKAVYSDGALHPVFADECRTEPNQVNLFNNKVIH